MSHKRMVYLRGIANGGKKPMHDTLKACNLAEMLHEGQQRKSGEPYVEHPMNVAKLLVDYEIRDDKVLAGAILHDVIEDCDITMSDLVTEYGISKETAQIVQLLTHDKSMSNEKYYSRMKKSPEAILIKLADRNHNLTTVPNIELFPIEKIKEKYYETRDFVLPLAKFGIDNYVKYNNKYSLLKFNIETLLIVMKSYIRAFDKDFEREISKDNDNNINNNNINDANRTMNTSDQKFVIQKPINQKSSYEFTM